MADRSVAVGDTLNKLRYEFNGTAEDIGDIQSILDASGYIASSTDIAEAIVAINSELPEIKKDSFIFPGLTMIFEGDTDNIHRRVMFRHHTPFCFKRRSDSALNIFNRDLSINPEDHEVSPVNSSGHPEWNLLQKHDHIASGLGQL